MVIDERFDEANKHRRQYIDKAKKMVEQYLPMRYSKVDVGNAKISAILCIDEILSVLRDIGKFSSFTSSQERFYQQVRLEIEKL